MQRLRGFFGSRDSVRNVCSHIRASMRTSAPIRCVTAVPFHAGLVVLLVCLSPECARLVQRLGFDFKIEKSDLESDILI